MKKEDIIKEIKKLNLQDKYVVGMGASLCMRDIRQETHDIDLGVSKADFVKLSQGRKIIDSALGQKRVLINSEAGNKIEVLDNKHDKLDKKFELFDYGNVIEKIEIDNIEGTYCQTIEDIITMKKRLGRKKDLEDLEKIYATM